MNTCTRFPRPSFGWRVAFAGFTALLGTAAFAQVAPAAAPDAKTLAKYDVNKNGVLDPAELNAMEVDQRKAAAAVERKGEAPRSGDNEVLALSPFEVVSEGKGYYA